MHCALVPKKVVLGPMETWEVYRVQRRERKEEVCPHVGTCVGVAGVSADHVKNVFLCLDSNRFN